MEFSSHFLKGFTKRLKSFFLDKDRSKYKAKRIERVERVDVGRLTYLGLTAKNAALSFFVVSIQRRRISDESCNHSISRYFWQTPNLYLLRAFTYNTSIPSKQCKHSCDDIRLILSASNKLATVLRWTTEVAYFYHFICRSAVSTVDHCRFHNLIFFILLCHYWRYFIRQKLNIVQILAGNIDCNHACCWSWWDCFLHWILPEKHERRKDDPKYSANNADPNCGGIELLRPEERKKERNLENINRKKSVSRISNKRLDFRSIIIGGWKILQSRSIERLTRKVDTWECSYTSCSVALPLRPNEKLNKSCQ